MKKVSKFHDFMVESDEFKGLGTSNYLNEIKFNKEKLGKVVQLYAKILANKMGTEAGRIDVEKEENFYRNDGALKGKGKGFRAYFGDGSTVRFSWDSSVKTSPYTLTSVDYWKPGKYYCTKPSSTIYFIGISNVIQVLKDVHGLMKTGIITESIEDFAPYLKDGKYIKGERNGKELRAWLTDRGLPPSYTKPNELVTMFQKKGKAYSEEFIRWYYKGEDVIAYKPSEESNDLQKKLDEVITLFDDTLYSDPETVFDDIEDLVEMVATKNWRTLIVCGQGGIGKTYHIKEGDRSLGKLLQPHEWSYHSGEKTAPFAFYSTLFAERDKIIVFDEADSVLKNKDIIMMLKPILDTGGDNMASYDNRTLTQKIDPLGKKDIEAYAEMVDEWQKEEITIIIADMKYSKWKRENQKRMKALMLGADEDDFPELEDVEQREVDPDRKLTPPKIPNRFFFTGGMIFISNMRAKEIDQAILSRSAFIDVYLAKTDVAKRIETIGNAMISKRDDVDSNDMKEIMEVLNGDNVAKHTAIEYKTPINAVKNKTPSVRALGLALALKATKLKNWKHLLALYSN